MSLAYQRRFVIEFLENGLCDTPESDIPVVDWCKTAFVPVTRDPAVNFLCDAVRNRLIRERGNARSLGISVIARRCTRAKIGFRKEAIMATEVDAKEAFLKQYCLTMPPNSDVVLFGLEAANQKMEKQLRHRLLRT